MKQTVQKLFIGFWLGLGCLQTWVLVQYGLSFWESCLDAVVTSTVLVMASYVMITIVKYFRPTIKNAVIVMVSALALSVFSGFIIFSSLQFLSQSDYYLRWINSTLLIRFIFIKLMVVMAATNGWLFFFIQEQQQNELRTKESDRLMREAELSNLRQQLQPHFLFNSLNSISALTLSQPEQARKMIEQLSDFLRGTVKKEANQLIPLSEELHHLHLYLEIEKVRFGHRLLTTLEADEPAQQGKLPSLLLQPILENAIKFGLYDTTGPVEIRIRARLENETLYIEVKNPFDGEMASAPRKGTGFGLRSVKRRLALLYNRNDLLTTAQEENWFSTSIKIPQQH
ncbi:MAG: histidine kinase [Bacteroidetes bacterium]|nr:histidine kinase [Bacteroidota bacterium]